MAHYAKNHTGICIEFERTSSNLLGNDEVCWPIQYDDHYPEINLGEMLKRNGRTLNQMMRYKAKCWEPEREWRLLVPNGNAQCEHPAKIARVIFGIRISDDFRAIIQRLCDEAEIPTVQATKARMQFKIVVPN